uniref:Uncharacterized protein n=1 Tax=Roseihalotalea indica TaxID=2867963 RepID=A0AA49GMG5_9BACT|nr:hypothetical protein K4G66_23150 [Tunicatimonas sp. TK19036]
MMTTKQTILSLLIGVWCTVAYGQKRSDVIYQVNDEPLACIIADVTPQEIKFKHLENPDGPDYVLKKEKALLIFKENGDFLLPAEEEADWVAGADNNAHKIITKDHQIHPAQFLEVQGTIINYQGKQGQGKQSIDTDNVLLIIYKDGRHELYSPPEEVAEGLEELGGKMDDYAASTTTVAEQTISGDVINLDAEQKAHFEKMAEVKANDFGKYLRIISNKEEDEEDKLYAIEAACKLFISDSSKVEVSSINRQDKKQYTIPQYLDRLRMLPYDKVELIWMQAQLVSQLRPGEDGKYYGVIAAQQLFRGYLDNEIVYQDVTDKNIEVVLARYEVFDEGVRKQKWDVFLSDIGVQQTREK